MAEWNIRSGHELTWTTIEDEFANGVTHGIGLLLAIGGFCSLIVLTSYGGDLSHIIGCMVYGISLVVLYGASTLYHFVRQPRLKRILQTVDHVAIYFFIAGTYTPFTLVNLHGFWSWMLFGLVWGLATSLGPCFHDPANSKLTRGWGEAFHAAAESNSIDKRPTPTKSQTPSPPQTTSEARTGTSGV